MATSTRRIITSLAMLVFASLSLWAQHYEGFVYNKGTGKALPGVKITFLQPNKKETLITNSKGYYKFEVSKGIKNYLLLFQLDGYVDEKVAFDTSKLKVKKLPDVTLTPQYFSSSNDNDLNDSFASFIVEDINEESPTSGQSPILLSASRDPYSNKAGFQFSPIRFRIRGYDAPYQEQLLNGLQMNNVNNGYSAWSLWNGLNNVTINQEVVEGIAYSPYAFGSVGGAVNISTRPSLFGKGGRITYSNSNRSYNHRTMVTYNTGLTNNGWALSVSGSKRWGQHGYALGQFYDAYGYFIGLEKRIGSNNSLMLYIIGAPTERGVASASTQEAYNLAGSNFYNPNVGIQNGKWRNARVRKNHEPIFQLQHELKTSNLTLTTSAGYRTGFSGYSALNWHNAPDPRPDYYRYLPSYYSYMTEQPNPFLEDYYTDLWSSKREVRYINWERLYEINRNNFQTIYSNDGKLLASGNRSEYVVEDRREDQRQFNASSVANLHINDNMKLDIGVNYRYNLTKNFNVISDLLGGDYWYDIDKFSERDFPEEPSKAQLDLNNPDRIVHKGDIYSHNYHAQTQKAQLWTNYAFNTRYIDGYVALEGMWTNTYRIGQQKRGLFPENSYGKSDILNFFDYGAKMGITAKFSGHHFVVANASYITQAPFFNDIFISPRTNNYYIDNPTSEKIVSTDISYVLRHPQLKGRISFFYSKFMDGTRKRSFYDDAHRAFSNIVLSNIARQHMGVEVGFEAKLTTALTATAVFTYANYTYANNPNYIQTVDNDRSILEDEKVYWNGFHVAGTPQTAANISFNYQTPFYMYLGVDFNYFSRNYIDLNPKLRTDIARDQLDEKFTQQEKFPAACTIDANIGYSYRIKSGKYLRLNLTITNILNNKGVKSGGFEQSRIRQTSDGKMMRPFDAKYYYMLGTNYFLNVAYVF